jgi:hypothetical protein
VSKILTIDLETVGAMNSSYGHVITAAAKFLGDKQVWVRDTRDYKESRKHPWNSLPLLNDLADVIDGSDMLVGFYSKDFDYKMITTPLLRAGRFIKPLPHVDLYWIAKFHLKLGRGSLDALSQYLGVESKFHLPPETWVKAMHGDKASMDLLKERASSDVRITEECYLKLRPLIRQHPRLLAGRANCRVCQGTHLQSRGHLITSNGIEHARYQCRDCGAWGYKVKGVTRNVEVEAIS